MTSEALFYCTMKGILHLVAEGKRLSFTKQPPWAREVELVVYISFYLILTRPWDGGSLTSPVFFSSGGSRC